MKTILFLVLAGSLVGAGCGPSEPIGPTAEPMTQAANETTITFHPSFDPKFCTEDARETESGRPAYPIAPVYDALPHLGQIYTALDCGNRERASQVAGMENAFYTAGIRLRWETGQEPTTDAKTVLALLGFDETSPGVWDTERAFTIDQLLLLKPVFLDPNAPKPTEDCLLCG